MDDNQQNKNSDKLFEDKIEESDINNELNSKWPINKNNFLAILLIISSVVLVAIILLILILTSKDKEPTLVKIRLKKWEILDSSKSSLTGEDLSKGKTDKNIIKAPSEWEVATAMGVISGNKNDIFKDTNLKKIDKTQFDNPWWFRTSFRIKSYGIGKNNKKNLKTLMHIYGINYKADMYIDGKLVEVKEKLVGTFIKFTIDISEFLDKKELHYVAFKIYRPHNAVGSKSNDTDLAISFVDWNPEAPDSNMGIWQPIDVQTYYRDTVTVSNGFVITKLSDNNDKANLTVLFDAKNWENKETNNAFQIEIENLVYVELKSIILKPKEEKKIEFNFSIDNPKLWWPYQMGNPTLHTLDIKAYSNKENRKKKLISEYKQKIGLREVKEELSADKKSKTYIINNKKILLKGAGWTPDLFLRENEKRYRIQMEYVKHMELNVVRLEGKSEHKSFYDICDELGILVISGWCCCDSWQRWDLWSPEVREIGRKSTRSQIKKLNPHPSVIVFIEGSDEHPSVDVETEWNEIFKEEKWQNKILSSATQKVSTVSGETGVKMTGPYSWVPAHYFTYDKTEEHGGDWSFMTEGGPGENPLRKDSYELVLNNDSIKWPLDDVWNYHCGLVNFVDLEKFIIPINKRYGDIKNLSDFERKSTLSTYDSHRAMFEAYSLNKYRSTGVIQWMLNNAWPSNIWHLYDYFFTPTPTYFTARKAGERIHAMYDYRTSSVFLMNNYYQNIKTKINVNLFVINGYNGKDIISQNSTEINDEIKGDSKMALFDVEENQTACDTYIIHLAYYYTDDDNKIVYRTNTYWRNNELDVIDYSKSTYYNAPITKYQNLKALDEIKKTSLNITTKYKKKNEHGYFTVNIKNIGENIALMIELKLFSGKTKKLIRPVHWEDNYFSLMKNDETYNVVAEYLLEDGNSTKPYLEVNGWNIDTMTIH